MHDPLLVRRIIAELGAEPTVDLSRADLNIIAGLVTLSGSVASFRQKNTVASTVRNASGVDSVINLLEADPAVATLAGDACAGSAHHRGAKPGLAVP